MRTRIPLWLSIAGYLLAPLAAQNWRPPAGNRPVLRRPGAESILPGGRIIAPLGRQFSTGPGPWGLAISPNGKTLVSGGLRSFAAQFEDDLNVFRLPGYATVQLAMRHGLTTQVSAIASWENLLDRRFYTGFTPVPAIGAPRLWRAGLRWEGRVRK